MRTNTITRLAEVVSMGLQAKRLMKSKTEEDKNKNRKELIQRFKKMKGLPNKVGQMMAMSAKREIDNDFMELVNNCEPMEFETVLEQIQSNLVIAPREIFEYIDPNGLAASLGQVHQAKMLDGRTVAMKVQYPGVAKAVKADSKLLGYLTVPFGGMSKGFDMPNYRAVIDQNLKAELNYIQEAQNYFDFKRMAEASGIDGWVVPSVISELSNEVILTTSWEEGINFQQVCKEWSQKDRSQVQKMIAQIFFYSLFDAGLFQSDPNPGNFSFRKVNGKIEVITYDFGSVSRVTKEEQATLMALLYSAKEGGKVNPYELYLGLGFAEDYLAPIAGKLPAMTELLVEPFFTDGKYDLKQWNRSERAEGILNDDRWNFRVAAPAEALLLFRAFSGLFYYLDRLDEPVWLKPLLQVHYIQLEKQVQEKLKHAAEKSKFGYEDMAQHLKMQVMQNGVQKVLLTMKRSCIEKLASIIPEDTLAKIQAHEVNLDEIVVEARHKQYEPQTLFKLDLGEGKEITVWLE